ncbi:MAG: hypothetical protein M1833_004684 [Piccolia ochrophora]|nr:MAG: hypothetical protein M1833_004684 [Piccolia ochrophora]
MGEGHRRVYYPGIWDESEELEEYRIGGYHPVHLGDYLANERYQIVHKLGNGGFATVWLAHDQVQKRYVALNIICADASSEDCRELQIIQHLMQNHDQSPEQTHIPLLLDHFRISGPNGTHLCLAMPVAGPRVRDFARARQSGRLPLQLARNVCLQASRTMAYLHASGVCHGDFHPANVLLKITNIDSWTEAEVYERLGDPLRDVVEKISGETPGPHAPSYVVKPIDMTAIDEQYLTQRHRTPPPYAAPRTHIRSQSRHRVGCMGAGLYPLRRPDGREPVPHDFGTPDGTIENIVCVLGKLPEPWWQSWEARKDNFDEEGRPLPPAPGGYALLRINLHYALSHLPAGGEETVFPEGIAKLDRDALNARVAQKTKEPLPEELSHLEDLLSTMLRYNPAERISVAEALELPWLSNVPW